MPRIPRLLIQGEPAVYHVISRTALSGFPMGDIEKDYFVGLLQKLGSVYFVETLGYSVMGNHIHGIFRMHTGEKITDDEIRERFNIYYGPKNKRELTNGQIPTLREKWSSLSEFIKELKQSFTRWYNKNNNRKGTFWGERFKSLLAEEGDALINLLAYVDLNAVRAGIVQRPEEYRWCSLGYHVQAGNKDDFLSLDFGLVPFADMSPKQRLRYYRRFVYGVGSLPSEKGAKIASEIIEKEEENDFELKASDRFRYRTRYFTDSGVIGTKEFVSNCYRMFQHHFTCRHEKKPKPIKGLNGVFSLKKLRENL
jgi:REP element-mobilizing transposase RayT